MTRCLLRPLSAIVFLFTFTASADVKEPEPVDVDGGFDSNTEEQLMDLALLPVGEVLERLQQIEYVADTELTHRAISIAFSDRVGHAISASIESLTNSDISLDIDSMRSGRIEQLVAKRVFEVFPEASADPLTKLYINGDTTERGNVVNASGMVAAGPRIRRLLLNALHDQATIERIDDEESTGDPLRVCDLAYNQLILRYRIQGFPRNLHALVRPEHRDSTIQRLKKSLSSQHRLSD